MIKQELFHEGVQERSGRYPWGSGKRPYQRLEGAGRKVGSAAKKAGKAVLRGIGGAVKFTIKATVITTLTMAAGSVLAGLGLTWMSSPATQAWLSGMMFRTSTSRSSDVIDIGENWLRGAGIF